MLLAGLALFIPPTLGINPSVVLLVAAAVMVQSLMKLRHANPGFNPAHLLVLRIAPPEARYDTGAKLLSFFDTVLDKIRALPGVASETFREWWEARERGA